MHSLCAVGDKTLVVTGSFLSYSRDKAELYSVERDEWSELPDLSEPRYQHSSCSFEQRYVFLFGGCTTGTDTSDLLERLDLLHKWQPWSTLPLALPSYPDTKAFKSPAVTEISGTEIAIFRGSTSSVLILNVNEMTLHERKAMKIYDFSF